MTPSTVDRVQIKVCGITTPEEAKACVDLGADMIGINCWEPSPRYVSKEKLSAITGLIGDHVETVALFVNEDPEKVNSLMEEYGFNTAQLHGDETPEYTMKINFPWFKAFRVHSEFQPSTIRRYGQSRFLLDAYAKNTYGGTGKTFNWDIAIDAKQQGHLMLAGGLTPENAADAVRKVKPDALDVCSGVESKPGEKDLAAVERFIQNVRMAEQELMESALVSQLDRSSS